ncbi:two-component system response regulator YesN [Paenibacillus phyllosphaerae]|uniref:Two-component system response regulator YesN n=1 Tax=Paenibacillus phyllosphaerae TaxID=274593 RepID=A0A7W5ATE0_9BACL|nr:response regulator [Paenibacillus phyllosphaerae]MBB3108322.1 two-component system response regulator YesN [Paenibacillus phyllosphaerae]
MYKVILVDDEAVVRDGLKNTIQWQEHGFELIGDYANGREALEAVELHKPDLIISDISMPFMDGLELTAAVGASYPYIKIIILTGFDEFDYAQQAIRLKVSDFIVKPITAAEIRQLLNKVRAEMDEESKRREDLSRLQSQLKQSLPLLKERFLERLVINGLGKSEVAERFAYFGLPPLTPMIVALVIDIDDFGERETFDFDAFDEEMLRFAAYDIVSEVCMNEDVLVFRTREERMVALVHRIPEESALYEKAFRVAEQIRHEIERYLKFTITIGIGRASMSVERLPHSYKSALSALDYRFLLGKNRVLSILDLEGKPSTLPPIASDWDRKLASAVKTGSVSEAQRLIELMVAELKAAMVPIESCVLHMQRIVLTLINTIQDLSAHEQSVPFDPQLMLTDVYRFKTVDEIEQWLKQAVQTVMNVIEGSRSHFTGMQIRRAIEYIETNYANEKMSLQELCRHVLMSTSYFSLVFKQHTGETFVEFLTRVRVEKAKELLAHTSLKFYEIADKVGYGDPNYFSILFKKHAGMTPREFRERSAG